ncbi:hypothetical protein ACFW6C_07435 [Streptomyces fungicidicus]|uniref:hypothetical protein n=1 Tax=Streptomyces fungicidicus TaxID=68203 RepID=UPI0036A93B66
MTQRIVDRIYSPPLGTIREAGPGAEFIVFRSATQRADWPRIWEALGVAYVRGATVTMRRD